MPLDSPEAYERLSHHLCEVDPIIEGFCCKTGFARQTSGISRYAMRRLVLSRDVQWWIELRMLEDENGERYDEFFPDVPYWLGGGGWVDLKGYRYATDRVDTFERMPFRLLAPKLAEGLQSTWDSIRGYTVDYLVSLSPKVKLDLHPRVEIVPEDEDKG